MKKHLLIAAAILAVIIICFILYRYGKGEAAANRKQMEKVNSE